MAAAHSTIHMNPTVGFLNNNIYCVVPNSFIYLCFFQYTYESCLFNFQPPCFDFKRGQPDYFLLMSENTICIYICTNYRKQAHLSVVNITKYIDAIVFYVLYYRYTHIIHYIHQFQYVLLHWFGSTENPILHCSALKQSRPCHQNYSTPPSQVTKYTILVQLSNWKWSISFHQQFLLCSKQLISFTSKKEILMVHQSIAVRLYTVNVIKSI